MDYSKEMKVTDSATEEDVYELPEGVSVDDVHGLTVKNVGATPKLPGINLLLVRDVEGEIEGMFEVDPDVLVEK